MNKKKVLEKKRENFKEKAEFLIALKTSFEDCSIEEATTSFAKWFSKIIIGRNYSYIKWSVLRENEIEKGHKLLDLVIKNYYPKVEGLDNLFTIYYQVYCRYKEFAGESHPLTKASLEIVSNLEYKTLLLRRLEANRKFLKK